MTEYTESEILFIYPRKLIFCAHIWTEGRIFAILNVYQGEINRKIMHGVCPHFIHVDRNAQFRCLMCLSDGISVCGFGEA